ncbi:hypothetical protein [uncultured Agrobacterium sp.]|uniref:hypothetical protein n=1 Tax=uncultured Agrobacterium sp. TaxID=157277 RepID=UPI0025DA4C09|nr:hypothetical protein [uncultured Agrobacterium sp.]
MAWEADAPEHAICKPISTREGREVCDYRYILPDSVGAENSGPTKRFAEIDNFPGAILKKNKVTLVLGGKGVNAYPFEPPCQFAGVDAQALGS